MARDKPSIDDLVDEILSDPGYATGARTPSWRPDAYEVLSVLPGIFAGTAQIDGVIPDIAANLGVTVACHEGCPSRCCESLVLVSVVEAWAIAAYLGETVPAARRSEVGRRSATWVSQATHAGRAAAAWARGDVDGYRQEMGAHGLQHLMCPFSFDARCEVYPVRPLRCRQPWVANTWEHCGASDRPDAPVVRLIAFAEMDAFFVRAERVLCGLQNAVGRGTERSPLVPTVLAALAAGEPR